MVAIRDKLMRHSVSLSLSLVTVAVLLSACDPGTKKPTLDYHWGAYEGLVYDMYANPGEATPVIQVDMLAAQIEQTRSRGEPVPPGVHAHLGYMHYISGNIDAALIEFDEERVTYPESATFIDGITRRLEGE